MAAPGAGPSLRSRPWLPALPSRLAPSSETCREPHILRGALETAAVDENTRILRHRKRGLTCVLITARLHGGADCRSFAKLGNTCSASLPRSPQQFSIYLTRDLCPPFLSHMGKLDTEEIKSVTCWHR